MSAPAATLGLDLGGTKCLGVALAADGTVVAEARRPTPRTGNAGIIDVLAVVAADLRTALGTTGVDAVGVGVPGLVNRDGVLRFAPNLPGVVELAVAAGLHDRVDVPVRVDNDATCATWGEHEAGAGRGSDHLILVTLGTGIGGGFVREGRLERGANGFAGEVGHMVIDPHGPPCPCGKRGCWERFASGSGLGRLAREAALAGRAPRIVEAAGGDPEVVRGEHVTAAAVAGDPQALEIFRQFGWWLALGLSNLANALDPDRIVIGGGLVEASDLILAPTQAAFGGLVEAGDHRPAIDILAASLGERAGAIGAAHLARAEATQ